MRRALPGLLLAVVSAAGCGHHEFEPPDREAKIEAAAASYTPALFDTIAWGTEDERGAVGNQVYLAHCRTCHGPLGQGTTDYAVERGLDVPSLTEPGWARAHPDSLHRVIYVGHPSGMPVFGGRKLSPREVDAVVGYILDVLRPDVLGQGAPGSQPLAPRP